MTSKMTMTILYDDDGNDMLWEVEGGISGEWGGWPRFGQGVPPNSDHNRDDAGDDWEEEYVAIVIVLHG